MKFNTMFDIMMKQINTFGIALILVAVCGCITRGPSLASLRSSRPWAEYQLYRSQETIRNGMSEAKVLGIVGTPDFKFGETWIWRYQKYNHFTDLKVEFIEGKVTSSAISEGIAD